MNLEQNNVQRLSLMYITNRPDVAQIAAAAGVDRIFIDMEQLWKSGRQGGMNTVQSHHTVADVVRVRKALDEIGSRTELLVRVNPVHDQVEGYESTEDEVDSVIAAGADIVMLPFFKTASEVERFLQAVSGRAKTMLLLETKEAVGCLEDILALPGIDSIHIGLNDLSISRGDPFLFVPLADGTVDAICEKLKANGIPYGFGGIASLGNGALPSEHIIAEHYRLGSSCAILSRSFCNVQQVCDPEKIRRIFERGIKEIRSYESVCACAAPEFFTENRRILVEKTNEIVNTFYQKRT